MKSNHLLHNKRSRLNRRFKRKFLGFFLVLSIFIFAALTVIFVNILQGYVFHMKNQIFQTISLQKNSIEQTFVNIFEDALLIGDHEHIRYDAVTQKPLMALAEEMRMFATRRKVYDQVRLLAMDGKEIVRINYRDGEFVIVDKELLQNKKHRYYFTEISESKKNTIYVSEFDLNIENNKIEKPIKPMIRFGTPFFDAGGRKKGIIVLNYLGQNIINDFYDQLVVDDMAEYMLLNKNGYWLICDNKDNTWMFMYPEKKHISFANDFSEEWKVVNEKTKGAFFSRKGLFCFDTVSPLRKWEKLNELYGENMVSYEGAAEKWSWKIVGYMSNKKLYVEFLSLLKKAAIIYLLFLVLILITSYAVAFTSIKRKEAEEKKTEALNMKMNLISVISHDLKSPLLSIREALGYIIEEKQDVFNGHEKKMLSRAKTHIDYLNRLTLKVLDFQKALSGTMSMDLERCHIKEIIDQVVDFIKPMLVKKHLKLSIDVPGGLPDIVVDKDKIFNVFVNILENARKYTEKGTITISVEKMVKFIRVSISDTGKGIRKEDQMRLFDDFYQTDTENGEKKEGVGLGLAIVKQIIKDHNGRIWVSSEYGKGATFSFTLPISIAKPEI